MSKLFAELNAVTEGMTGAKIRIGDIDAKVADVASLLSLKAEKDQVATVENAVAGTRQDVDDIRKSMPGAEIEEKVRRVQAGLETKADKNALNKLSKTVKNGMKDESDPAFIKRCLSCDRPLEGRDEGIEIAQTYVCPPSFPYVPSFLTLLWRSAYFKQFMTTLTQTKSPQQTFLEKKKEYERGRYDKKDSYMDYSKPKSPYKRLTQVGVGGGGSGGGGGVYKTRPKSAHSGIDARRQMEDSRRFGAGGTQPLHVALFQNDGLDRTGGGAAGGWRKDVAARGKAEAHQRTQPVRGQVAGGSRRWALGGRRGPAPGRSRRCKSRAATSHSEAVAGFVHQCYWWRLKDSTTQPVFGETYSIRAYLVTGCTLPPPLTASGSPPSCGLLFVRANKKVYRHALQVGAADALAGAGLSASRAHGSFNRVLCLQISSRTCLGVYNLRSNPK